MVEQFIQLQSRISYPREAEAGSTYLVSVDLDHQLEPDDWPYADEEYSITCFLDAAPFFDQEPEGDSTIIVHRYGGSYGPVRFWLTARAIPVNDAAGERYRPQIQVVLVDGAGEPIYTQVLSDIKIVARGTPSRYRPLEPAGPRSKSATRASRIERAKQKVFRWLHLGDLQFGREGLADRPGVAEAARDWVARSGKRIDAVIVSGDISYSGRAEEFEQAGTFLRDLRSNIGAAQARMPPLLVVPGNHDCELIQDVSLPRAMDWSFESSVRRAFWEEPAARSGVVRAFENFVTWSRRTEALGASGGGLLPGDCARTLNVEGLRVGIVGLNDSMLMPPYRDARADLHPEQLRAACGDVALWAAGNDLRILVTHHHVDSLLPQMRHDFYRTFAPRSLFDIHLYGSTKFTSRLTQSNRDGRYMSASINAARLNGKGPQGFRIGEATLVAGSAVKLQVWPFDAERNGSKVKQGRVESTALGRRPRQHIAPAGAAPAQSEVSVISATPLADAPVRARLALLVGVEYLTDPPGKKRREDLLLRAFQDAGYGKVEMLRESASHDDVLSKFRELCATTVPEDLLVFVHSAFVLRIVKGTAHFTAYYTKNDWWRVTCEEVFEIARTAQRRVLVIGDLAPGNPQPPPGCGFIGQVYFREAKRRRGRAIEAVVSALRAASAAPTIMKNFVSMIESHLVSAAGGEEAIRPWSVLTEEMSQLVVADPRERMPGPSEPQEAKGFDPKFLPGVVVTLPHVLVSHRSDVGPLINYDHFSLLMNSRRRMAWFGAVNVDLNRRIDSKVELDWETWRADRHVPRSQQLSDDIFKFGPFDRARLIKKMLVAWGTEAQARRAFAATGAFTNLIPLVAPVNRNPLWVALPDYIAEHHARDKRISMLTGPVFATDDPLFRNIRVPTACWRVIALTTQAGEPAAAAFLTYQITSMNRFKSDLPKFRRKLPRAPIVTRLPIQVLGTLTHLDFGSLPDIDLTAFEPPVDDSSAISGVPVSSLEAAFPRELGSQSSKAR